MKWNRSAGAPISVILAIVFPAMVGSALALAYFGYLYAEDVSRRMEAADRQTAWAEAGRLIESVEARVDGVTKELFDKLALPEEGRDAEGCEANTRPAADAFVMVRFNARARLEIICHNGPVTREDWRDTFLRSLDFASIQPGRFRFVHQRIDRQDALVAFMRKQTHNGKGYYVVLRLAESWVRQSVETEIATLAERRRVTVLDQRRRSVAGTLLSGPVPRKEERFLVERAFGKILYAWDLQLAPRDVETLQAQAERQRVLGPLLVILSTVIIGVGLVIVWLGVLAERRASRLKSDFIANVSHELKTPLSLIRMFGEMVATGRNKGPEAVKEYGGIITRESERLSHLIDNVLDFARLERGKASYHFAEGDLAELLDRALDLCRYRLEKERLRLDGFIEPELPPVRMDENAMTLVILNLVDNAIKYAAEGGAVHVGITRRPGGVILWVRDFGPGIPVDERERIFDRFYRARNARDRNVRGSGIGLSLVKHIAEAHGGRVTVEAPTGAVQPGVGTVFSVHLPASVAERASLASMPSVTAPSSGSSP